MVAFDVAGLDVDVCVVVFGFDVVSLDAVGFPTVGLVGGGFTGEVFTVVAGFASVGLVAVGFTEAGFDTEGLDVVDFVGAADLEVVNLIEPVFVAIAAYTGVRLDSVEEAAVLGPDGAVAGRDVDFRGEPGAETKKNEEEI